MLTGFCCSDLKERIPQKWYIPSILYVPWKINYLVPKYLKEKQIVLRIIVMHLNNCKFQGQRA